MTLKLKFIRETDKARLYERANGSRMWIPRSACTHTLKHSAEPGDPPIHEVTYEEWWAARNPWPEVGQKEMGF